MSDRVFTDADVLALKATLGAEIDAWIESLEEIDDPDPDPEPTPGPPTNPSAVPGDGRIVLTWDPPEHGTPTGYRAGHAGPDATGKPWSGLLPASAGTATLDRLVNGTPYLVTLSAVYPAGDVGVSITVTPTSPVTPDPTPTPVGTAWLSGVADDNVGRIRGWAGFRGEDTTYVRTWADAPGAMESLSRMGEVTASGYSGVLDLCVGGPSDWTDAANGGYDDEWVAQCRKALSLWGSLQRLDLSMAHEFNNGYPWKVSANEQEPFKRAWPRWHKIVQAELVAKGKNAKVVLPCNSDTNSGWTIADGLPDTATFDYLGCDFYNFWPSLNTQAAWDANKSLWKGGTPRGIQAWVDFAKSIGKPITFPEWGLAPSGPFAVDSPFFIQAMNRLFRAIAPTDPYNPGAGKLAGEAYFSAWDGHGRLYPTAVNAGRSRDAYVALSWGRA